MIEKSVKSGYVFSIKNIEYFLKALNIYLLTRKPGILNIKIMPTQKFLLKKVITSFPKRLFAGSYKAALIARPPIQNVL